MLPGVKVRLLCVLIAVACDLVQAEPLRQISTFGYVTDFANVLDPPSTEALDELCSRVEYWTGTQLDVITVPSLGGDSSRTYALRVFNEGAHAIIGDLKFPESGDRRIVIIFGAKERKITIIAGAEVRPILSGKVRRYQREVLPYLRRHQDGQAIAFLTNRIAEDIAADAQVGLKEVNSQVSLGGWAPVAQPYDVLIRSLRAMIALWFVVIVAIFLAKRVHRRRPADPALTCLVIGNEPCKNLTT